MSRYLPVIGVVLCVSVVVTWIVASASGQAGASGGRAEATAPQERAAATGVAVTVQSLDDDEAIAHRVDRLLALYVPADTAPSARVPAGRFSAEWRGDLHVPLRDAYEFRFVGRGAFALHINDELVLEVEAAGPDAVTVTSDRLWLRQGANRVRASYTAPSSGDAQARLEWSSPDFRFEPPTPESWTHDPDQPDLAHADQLRHGRALLAQQRCTRCHTPPDDLVGPTAMADLVMDAPQIIDAGLRFEEAWLAEFIRDPHVHRSDATMPAVFEGDHAEQAARDIAAYLATLDAGALSDDSAVAMDPASIEAGGRLYASLGCVGCHTLDQSEGDRLGLGHLASKFKGPALRDYLEAPGRRYVHTAMPDFDLDRDEADALAAFLLDATEREADNAPAVGDADRGQLLAAQAGCNRCHALPIRDELDAPMLAALADWSAGCLADDQPEHIEPGEAPRLNLDDRDRQALRALAQLDWHDATRHSSADYLHRQLDRLSCNACHTLDGTPDRWSLYAAEVAHLMPEREGDSGQPPIDQTRPDLTWAGDKLQIDYLRRLLAGDLDDKPRPWLDAVMPAYPMAAAGGFAEALAMSHGLPPQREATEVDPELAEIGRRLTSDRFGFGCTDCHGVGDYPPQNVFDAIGNNFADAADRLRPGFYQRWMHDPLRYAPRTKMPRYTDRHGYTALADILDGHGQAQFEALWHYLMTEPDENPLGE